MEQSKKDKMLSKLEVIEKGYLELKAKAEKYEKTLKEIGARNCDYQTTNTGKLHDTECRACKANEALSGEGKEVEKPMQYNTCKTCGANNGRAGMLINDDCLNCHETRKTGAVTIHTNLERTQGEIDKTIGILNQKEVK